MKKKIKLSQKQIRIIKEIDLHVDKLLNIKCRIRDLGYVKAPEFETSLAAKQASKAFEKFEYIEQLIWDFYAGILKAKEHVK